MCKLKTICGFLLSSLFAIPILYLSVSIPVFVQEEELARQREEMQRQHEEDMKRQREEIERHAEEVARHKAELAKHNEVGRGSGKGRGQHNYLQYSDGTPGATIGSGALMLKHAGKRNRHKLLLTVSSWLSWAKAYRVPVSMRL